MSESEREDRVARTMGVVVVEVAVLVAVLVLVAVVVLVVVLAVAVLVAAVLVAVVVVAVAVVLVAVAVVAVTVVLAAVVVVAVTVVLVAAVVVAVTVVLVAVVVVVAADGYSPGLSFVGLSRIGVFSDFLSLGGLLFAGVDLLDLVPKVFLSGVLDLLGNRISSFTVQWWIK